MWSDQGIGGFLYKYAVACRSVCALLLQASEPVCDTQHWKTKSVMKRNSGVLCLGVHKFFLISSQHPGIVPFCTNIILTRAFRSVEPRISLSITILVVVFSLSFSPHTTPHGMIEEEDGFVRGQWWWFGQLSVEILCILVLGLLKQGDISHILG